MNKCCDCKKEKTCRSREGSHKYCFEPKPQTNYDRIKNMSVEEMAEWLANSNLKQCKKDFLKCIKTNCVNCQKEWLESEVSENGRV